MKCIPVLLMTILLTGCASTVSTKDVALYGTPPSEQDLYEYMSQYRDQLPPTRYVSYRDKGYADSVEKLDYTNEHGEVRHGWEYNFEVATYDTLDDSPIIWTPRRAIFFNGRPINLQIGGNHPNASVNTPSPPNHSR